MSSSNRASLGAQVNWPAWKPHYRAAVGVFAQGFAQLLLLFASLIKTTSLVITPREVTRLPSFAQPNEKIRLSSKLVNCFGAPPSIGCPQILSMPPAWSTYDKIPSVGTPVQRRVPLNLHRRGNVKYVECRTTFEMDHLQTPARVLLFIVVPERDQFSVRRNRRSDRYSSVTCSGVPPSIETRQIVYGLFRVGVLEEDPLAVGRKGGPRALRLLERQLLRTAAVAIDSPDLKDTGAVRMKDDVTIIRRNNRRIISSAR